MPKEKVLLAIDVGSVRMGLAIWRERSGLVTPLEVLARKTLKQDLARFRDLIEKEQVEALVVGLPISLTGRETESTENARFWAEKLRENFALPVYFQDESLSTKEANTRMREGGKRKLKKERRDGIAAAIFLEEFLRARAGS